MRSRTVTRGRYPESVLGGRDVDSKASYVPPISPDKEYGLLTLKRTPGQEISLLILDQEVLRMVSIMERGIYGLSLQIDGEEIARLLYYGGKGNQAKIGISAPKSVKIFRGELIGRNRNKLEKKLEDGNKKS